MEDSKNTNKENIVFSVRRIIFTKDDWAVIEGIYPDSKKVLIATGSFSDVKIGQTVSATGVFENHPKFGKQFKTYNWSSEMPNEEDGIYAYLSKGFVKGIGKTYADRLIAAFGNDVLEVIDKQPLRLLKVEGIGKKRQAAICTAWKKEKNEIKAKRDTLIGLLGLGFSPKISQRIWNQYKEEALHTARKNPYAFIPKIKYFGFFAADAIAQKNGIQEDSPFRINAALSHILNVSEDEGHCFLPRELLVEKTCELLNLGNSAIETVLDLSIKKGFLIAVNKDKIYRNDMFVYESESAKKIQMLINQQLQDIIPQDRLFTLLKRLSKLHYNNNQIKAVLGVFNNPVSIITGGPGTGKTTTLKAIISLATALGWEVSLCAPTGRAAKKAQETSGATASTIHRLLEYDAFKGSFKRNKDNKLTSKLVIVDEASMIDAALFHALIMAVPEQTRLVLLGDIDQLESVGAGAVLEELVSINDISLFRLTEIMRQSIDSRIILTAHSIINGEEPDLTNRKDGDFFFIEEDDPEKILETLADLVSKRLPSFYGIVPENIQILSPMHKGILGTENLNRVIRDRLNPANDSQQGNESLFRPGDRVMQTENNYNSEIFNGDLGRVLSITDKGVLVRFMKDVLYPHDALSQLVLAYAITIHKSQGSEYPAVLLPCTTSHFIMLNRNLIYTAITRAKKILVIVGTKKAISLAIANEKKKSRFTSLAEFILNPSSKDFDKR